MDRDQPGESHFAYRQWNDSPTWMMDRGRDDHGMHQSDEHVASGFHAALISHKDKIAQLADASVAFITMKKTAGLMGAVKSIGGMAARNPHLAGAAIGAGAGAIVGGPNHRLSGAAVGAGAGALGGRMLSRGVPAATHAAESAAAKTVANPLANQSPAALEAARAELSAGGPIRGVGESGARPSALKQAPSSVNSYHGGPMSGRSQLPPSEGSYHGGPTTGAITGFENTQISRIGPASHPALQTQVAKRPQFAAGSTPRPRPMANATELPRPDFSEFTDKVANYPFFVADNSKTATIGGELSAIKSAQVLGNLVEAADRPGGFKLPGAGSFVGIVDDLAQIGRQKLQHMISNRQRPGQENAKIAAPYDGSPLMDMRQRAADRHPEVVSPIENLRTDFKSNLKLIQDKLHDQALVRHEQVNSKTASASLDYKELAHLGGMPKQLMTRAGATTAGVGALLGGGMAYLSSRGKKEHGGRSQAEIDLEKSYSRQPEHPEGIRQTIGKHVVGLHKDVAEQMRKHPIAATAMGAGAGAGLALRLAPMLGLISRVK